MNRVFSLFHFRSIDEQETENSDSKRSTSSLMDHNSNSDDERNKRETSDSLEIKRERNESGNSKNDENDTESNAINNGKLEGHFYYIFPFILFYIDFE